jgi:hypothetical protein
MKRLFPRAVPEAVIALLLFGGCAPTSPVKPGAPVLTMLTIVSPTGGGNPPTRFDVTPDTTLCPTGYAENATCDTGTAVCELGANVVCHCDVVDMCAPTVGQLHCTYSPLSMVIATFDRLLDTTPFEPGTTTSVATLSAMPAPPMPASLSADYTSTGSPTGLIFTNFAALVCGSGPCPYANIVGPTIGLAGSPGIPSGATVTVALDAATVLAKDQKTPFTGTGLLANGTLAFKSAPFTASITPPAPPPPMSTMTMAAATCPDASMSNMDGGTDASEGGGDAPASEGGSPDGGADALAEAGAGEVGATADAGAADASASDAGASDAGASDAGATTPPASNDVPLSMNTTPIEIDFSNLVPSTFLPAPAGDGGATDAGATDAGATTMFVTITENSTDFTAFMATSDTTFPTATVKIAPTAMWAAGKTYVITVAADTADVLGTQLGMPVTATFTMGTN